MVASVSRVTVIPPFCAESSVMPVTYDAICMPMQHGHEACRDVRPFLISRIPSKPSDIDQLGAGVAAGGRRWGQGMIQITEDRHD